MEEHMTSLPYAQVLLVEDNPDDIELTLEAMKTSKVHMDVHVVSDGPSALAFLRREGEFSRASRPDLILLDLNLPLMDGREVLQAVRADPEFNGLPVVVLTSSDDEQDICRAYRLQANAYVTKPVDFSRFSETIRQIEGFWLQLARIPRQRCTP